MNWKETGLRLHAQRHLAQGWAGGMNLNLLCFMCLLRLSNAPQNHDARRSWDLHAKWL